MGKPLIAGAGMALSVAALAAWQPVFLWKHLAWAWFQGGYTLGLQHGCHERNPLLAVLFRQAELAELAALPAGDPGWGTVPELPGDAYSWAALGEVSANWTQPVIVRGLLDASVPAVQRWADLDYLVDAFPAHRVSAFTPFGDQQWHVRGEYCGHDNVDWPDPVNFTMVKRALAGGGGMRTSGSFAAGEARRRVSEELQEAERFADLPLLLPTPALIFSQGPEGVPGPWLSTDWHNAAQGGLSMEIAGRKTFELVSPAYGHMMRPVVWFDGFTTRGFPAADVLARLPRSRVTLGPGDALFVPPWVWHRVWLEDDGWNVVASWRVNLFRQMLRNDPWLSAGFPRAVALSAARQWLL